MYDLVGRVQSLKLEHMKNRYLACGETFTADKNDPLFEIMLNSLTEKEKEKKEILRSKGN